MKLSDLYKHTQYCTDLAEQAQQIADFGAQWQLEAQAAIATAITPAINNIQAITDILTPLSRMGLSQMENFVDTMRSSLSSADLLQGMVAQWQLETQTAI